MSEADYRIGECLHEGPGSVVFRARRLADDRPVVLKRTREHLAATTRSVRRELDVTRAAAGEGVIGVYGLDPEAGLVLEDIGGRSVALVTRRRRLSLDEAVRVALAVARTLARLHAQDLVHRDVNPSNVVLNEATGEVRLIDFGIAQVLSRETVYSPAGTPRYAPPEQTGRMNRPVDPRSDLYALGATLYEWLTGQPPFDARDRLDLVHAHIARVPTPAHELNPEVPLPLSRVLATLLEKEAERRYHGARGLVHDLERCLALLRDPRGTPPFTLREADADERLRVPQSLYGRDRELAVLREACDAAARGHARLLLVAGPPGIGKTSFVREMHRLLAGGRARTVEGKYDQYRRGEPYLGVVDALRDLARQLLAEPEAELSGVRARLREALEPNGRVLTELVPELEAVLGVQPEVEALPPAEARNRLQLTVGALLRALSTPDRPLVVFLDDLQWADLPSFELVERVVGEPTLHHALVVGALRDNEVDADHALHAMVRALGGEAPVDRVVLGPLGEDDVLRLVSDTVAAAPGHLRLASTCFDHTRGNAFYLNRFLESLHQEGLLRFDPTAGHWRWALDAIVARPVTDNVVDFLAERLRRLTPDARAVLAHASAIGDHFRLGTLAVAWARPPRTTLEALREALRAELVQPEGGDFWFPGDDAALPDFLWRFTHDRIRQACAALLGVDEAEAVHARVGLVLLEELDETGIDAQIFDVVDHLARGAARLDPAARARLLSLRHRAGRRALGSAAFAAADRLLRAAVAELPPDAWTAAPRDALALHLDAARAAWLCGDLAAMEALLAELRAHATRDVDRAAAEEIRIDAMLGQQRFADAVETSLEALRSLGVDVPVAPTGAEVGAALAESMALLADLAPDAIDALPPMVDEAGRIALRIQMAAMSSAYLARPALVPLLTANLVRGTLRDGVSRVSPYGFAVLGLVLNASDQLEMGRKSGEVCRRLLDRVDDRVVRPRSEHILYNQVLTFHMPLRPAVEEQARIFRLGMDVGDLEYAAWAIQAICCNGFYAGTELRDLGPRIARHLVTMRHHGQVPALACSAPWGQLVENLLGHAEDPARLVGPTFDEDEQMRMLRAIDFRGAAYIVTVTGTFARFVFRRLDEALAWADAGAEFADGAGATWHLVWWHTWRTLAWLGLDGNPDEVAGSRARLQRWCDACPANHTHRIALIDAEVARVRGDDGEAMRLYDRALTAARAWDFAHEAAVAAELAGRFYLSRGLRLPARAYLAEAVAAWRRWGAVAKATHLAEEFRTLLADTGARPAPVDDDTATDTTDGGARLDLESLFRGAAALAGEMHLERLLARTLDIAIENAGATRGLLFLHGPGGLRVAAARGADGSTPWPADVDLATLPRLTLAATSYAARSGEALLLADARDDRRFRAHSPDHALSVLAQPMAKQSTPVGLVYLENDLIAGAFSPERARVVALLAAQAAISIENARLYRHLDEALDRQVRLTDAHRRFVPHPFLENLSRKDITEVRLGDAVRKEMSTLFADIREFTGHVAGLHAAEHIGFVNEWYGYMEPPILRHGGFVDSYIGDAVMALFDDADGALLAAIAMQEALGDYNRGRARPVDCGFGVSTGEVTLGTLGTEHRVKCGVIGDAVNVASRVESLTRTYGVPVLTTDDTRARLRQRYAMRRVDRVVVKGHHRPVMLYEVYDGDPAALRHTKDSVAGAWDAAAAACDAGDFARAAELYADCADRLDGDPVAARLLERARAFAASPPTDWDGVVRLLHK